MNHSHLLLVKPKTGFTPRRGQIRLNRERLPKDLYRKALGP